MADSTFTQEIASEICERIANGESLRSICRDKSMPAMSTVFLWLTKDKLFSEQYARARETQAETMVDEILSIADSGENDTYTDENGKTRVDTDVIARSRLRVDARKWVAAKLLPKKYGDKIMQEVTGKDGGALQIERIERVIIDTSN